MPLKFDANFWANAVALKTERFRSSRGVERLLDDFAVGAGSRPNTPG